MAGAGNAQASTVPLLQWLPQLRPATAVASIRAAKEQTGKCAWKRNCTVPILAFKQRCHAMAFNGKFSEQQASNAHCHCHCHGPDRPPCQQLPNGRGNPSERQKSAPKQRKPKVSPAVDGARPRRLKRATAPYRPRQHGCLARSCKQLMRSVGLFEQTCSQRSLAFRLMPAERHPLERLPSWAGSAPAALSATCSRAESRCSAHHPHGRCARPWNACQCPGPRL